MNGDVLFHIWHIDLHWHIQLLMLILTPFTGFSYLPNYILLKAGVGHNFTLICLVVLPYSGVVYCVHHIEWIRGITAYSSAQGESLWQVCGGAWVNSHVGTIGLSPSAGMTAQVSPGTCSVRLDPWVHLETVLLMSLPAFLWDSLTFDVSYVWPGSPAEATGTGTSNAKLKVGFYWQIDILVIKFVLFLKAQ